MKRIYTIYYAAFIVAMLCCSSCRKQFLDTKPDASLVVPSSLEDYQAILDNVKYMNGASPGTLGAIGNVGGPNPSLQETACDNYYIPDNQFTPLLPYYKNIYLWDKDDAYGGQLPIGEWSIAYKGIFYANVVLDGLENVTRTAANAADWDRIKASALFYRAHVFYQLAQVFAPVYQRGKAREQLGIPLKIKSDISEKTVRSTLEETYQQIFSDLATATALMPATPPLYKTRPSLPAIYALQARTYLAMSDYSNAKLFAQKCLDAYNRPLLNFNSLSSATSYPIPKFNDEVIFSAMPNTAPNTYLVSITTTRVDSNLYASYANNDLRKDLFFRLREPNAYSYRGSFDGNGVPFFGIATDEQYLILAECSVRLHDVTGGLKYLNDLLKTRYRTTAGVSSFTPYSLTDENQALSLVLAERRKELIMRGLRLTDLRRLNMEPAFAISLYRKIDGKTYVLPPNDPRYTWPIPDDVIALTGIQQNPR